MGKIKPRLILMVGAPGSGKTTKSLELVKEGFIRVSADVIRGELYGDENIQGEYTKVFTEFHKRLDKAIADRANIVVDNTNLRWKYRRDITQKAKDSGYEIEIYIFKISYQECLKRNKQRTKVVPEDVIKRMWKVDYGVSACEGKIHYITE